MGACFAISNTHHAHATFRTSMYLCIYTYHKLPSQFNNHCQLCVLNVNGFRVTDATLSRCSGMRDRARNSISAQQFTFTTRTHLSMLFRRHFGREHQLIDEAEHHQQIETEIGEAGRHEGHRLEGFFAVVPLRHRFIVFVALCSYVGFLGHGCCCGRLLYGTVLGANCGRWLSGAVARAVSRAVSRGQAVVLYKHTSMDRFNCHWVFSAIANFKCCVMTCFVTHLALAVANQSGW